MYKVPNDCFTSGDPDCLRDDRHIHVLNKGNQQRRLQSIIAPRAVDSLHCESDILLPEAVGARQHQPQGQVPAGHQRRAQGSVFPQIRHYHVTVRVSRESALQKKCSAMTAVPQLSSEANNVTKFLSSVYTTPSSADISRVQHKSEFRDTFLPPNQHSHIHSSGHNDLLGSKADGQGGVVEKSFKHGGSLRGSRSQQG